MSAPDGHTPRGPSRAARDRAPYPALRAVGGVVTLLLVGGGALSSLPSMMTREADQETALPGSMTRLVVDAPRGDITVNELPDGGEPRVESRARWAVTRPELTVREEADGDLVRLEASCTGTNLGVCSMDVVVWVPPGTGLEIDGAWGDVDLTTTGEVDVTLTGGDITVDGAPPRAVLATTLGDVDVDHAGPPPDLVRVRTTAGSVRLLLPDDAEYAVTTATSQGTPDVQVTDVVNSPHVIDVQTTLGDIDVDPG